MPNVEHLKVFKETNENGAKIHKDSQTVSNTCFFVSVFVKPLDDSQSVGEVLHDQDECNPNIISLRTREFQQDCPQEDGKEDNRRHSVKTSLNSSASINSPDEEISSASAPETCQNETFFPRALAKNAELEDVTVCRSSNVSGSDSSTDTYSPSVYLEELFSYKETTGSLDEEDGHDVASCSSQSTTSSVVIVAELPSIGTRCKLTDSASSVSDNNFQQKSGPLLCELCGDILESRFALESHLVSHKRTFTCSYCSIIFSSRMDLRSHIRAHIGDRLYSCDLCKQTFWRKFTLEKHLKKFYHQRGRSNNQGSFKRENFGNQDGLPPSRPLSGRAFIEGVFKAKSRLQPQVRSPFRSFPCKHCEIVFAANIDLRQHRRLHIGERSYPCWICHQSFRRMFTLERHLRDVHNNCKDGSYRYGDKALERVMQIGMEYEANSLIAPNGSAEITQQVADDVLHDSVLPQEEDITADSLHCEGTEEVNKIGVSDCIEVINENEGGQPRQEPNKTRSKFPSYVELLPGNPALYRCSICKRTFKTKKTGYKHKICAYKQSWKVKEDPVVPGMGTPIRVRFDKFGNKLAKETRERNLSGTGSVDHQITIDEEESASSEVNPRRVSAKSSRNFVKKKPTQTKDLPNNMLTGIKQLNKSSRTNHSVHPSSSATVIPPKGLELKSANDVDEEKTEYELEWFICWFCRQMFSNQQDLEIHDLKTHSELVQ